MKALQHTINSLSLTVYSVHSLISKTYYTGIVQNIVIYTHNRCISFIWQSETAEYSDVHQIKKNIEYIFFFQDKVMISHYSVLSSFR